MDALRTVSKWLNEETDDVPRQAIAQLCSRIAVLEKNISACSQDGSTAYKQLRDKIEAHYDDLNNKLGDYYVYGNLLNESAKLLEHAADDIANFGKNDCTEDERMLDHAVDKYRTAAERIREYINR